MATSRCLYNVLRRDFPLPSIRTLQRLTSKTSNITDSNFIKRIVSPLPDEQKEVIIVIDEIHVKKAMSYHGGKVLGRAKNNPKLLANSVLGVMVKCMKGGPTMLTKMVPVCKLNADFQHEVVGGVSSAVKQAGGKILAYLVDDNRTNQSFFNKFKTIPNKPWLTEDGTFLIFDFVHITKNVRNNWLSDKAGELVYYDGDVQKTARWKHLTTLFQAESRHGLKSLKRRRGHADMQRRLIYQLNRLTNQFCNVAFMWILAASSKPNYK